VLKINALGRYHGLYTKPTGGMEVLDFYRGEYTVSREVAEYLLNDCPSLFSCPELQNGLEVKTAVVRRRVAASRKRRVRQG